MRKTKKVKKTIKDTVITDILCNLCGKSCDHAKRAKGQKKHFNEFSGLIENEIHGGYESEVIGDGVSWRFSLCEFCLDKLSKNFKIPVEISHPGVNKTYEPAPKYFKRLKLKP